MFWNWAAKESRRLRVRRSLDVCPRPTKGHVSCLSLSLSAGLCSWVLPLMLIINLVSSHNDHHGLPIVLVVVSLNYILSVWNYNGGEQLNCTESSHFVPFKSPTLDAIMMRTTMMGTILPIQRLSTSNAIQFCCSSWSLCPIFSFWENNEGHGWPGLNSSLTLGEPTSNGNYLWFSHCPALITRNFCSQQ